LICIISDSHYAPYNIATEEYLLKTKQDNCFLLYRNAPSIIVGRHQNTLAEINYDYVREHDIPVVRRMTGGGTVFHDLGNLNFCFIMLADGEGWTFEKYTAPILELLSELGIKAELQGRNDLTIDGLKFSGNAKLVWRNKVLQHGTILFSSRMTDLSQALTVNPLKFADKAVKSVRARVTNVSEHLPHPLTIEEFVDKLHAHVKSMYPQAQDYAFAPEEKATIRQLVDEKYGTWDWNFGISPKYNYSKAIRAQCGTIEVYLDVHKGRIAAVRIFGDFFARKDLAELEDALTGLAHQEDCVLRCLEESDVSSFFGDLSATELLPVFF